MELDSFQYFNSPWLLKVILIFGLIKLINCQADDRENDKDGNMLPGPSTSGQADDHENEINAVNEEELLYSENELESGQRSPKSKRPSETYSPKVTSKRTRYDDSTIALKKKRSKRQSPQTS